MFQKFLILTSLLPFINFGSGYSANDSVPECAILLSRYIQYNSVTGNERDAGIFFSDYAREKGLYVNIFTDDPASFNFSASLYPLESGKPNVILLNHIDVVPADYEHSTYPPFDGIIADSMVWGRGAIDNKGMAVMQIKALLQFVEIAAQYDLPYNITLLSVSGEETGGHNGAKIIASEFLDILNPVVVFGEGGAGLPGILRKESERSLFGISVALKRSMWLELTLFNPSSGHGSVTPSNYAVQDQIIALSNIFERRRRTQFSDVTYNMFQELGKIEGGIRGFALRNIRVFKPFVIPTLRNDEITHSLITNTITITGLNTQAGPPNQIPQSVTAILDCRLLPGTDADQFIDNLMKVLDNDAISIKVLHIDPLAPVSEQGVYYHYMEEALKEVFPGAGVVPILFPATNDNHFFREKGIPAYGILPAFMPIEILQSIHNVDERIPVESIEHGIKVYSAAIRGIQQL